MEKGEEKEWGCQGTLTRREERDHHEKSWGEKKGRRIRSTSRKLKEERCAGKTEELGRRRRKERRWVHQQMKNGLQAAYGGGTREGGFDWRGNTTRGVYVMPLETEQGEEGILSASARGSEKEKCGLF